MTVMIFRADNWSRIRNGGISRRDLMGLDREQDKELIGYLIAHAPENSRDSMMKYAAKHYGMDQLPEVPVNTDDPDDPLYWKYMVLREQILQETDVSVLIEAALHNPDPAAAAFAFCRLTGYRMPVKECDAYSYRTYECGILQGTAEEEILGLCRKILAGNGPLQAAAEEYLRAHNRI